MEREEVQKREGEGRGGRGRKKRVDPQRPKMPVTVPVARAWVGEVVEEKVREGRVWRTGMVPER